MNAPDVEKHQGFDMGKGEDFGFSWTVQALEDIDRIGISSLSVVLSLAHPTRMVCIHGHFWIEGKDFYIDGKRTGRHYFIHRVHPKPTQPKGAAHMNQTVEFDFSVGEKVTIKLSGRQGNITQASISTHGLKSYLVEYANATGDIQSGWFFDEEISAGTA